MKMAEEEQKRTDAYNQTITVKQLESLARIFNEYHIRKSNHDAVKLAAKEIGRTVGLSRQTVECIYEEFIEDPNLSKRRLAIEYKKTCRGVPVSVKNDMRTQYVKKIVDSNCMLSIREIYKIMVNIPFLIEVTKPDPVISPPMVKKILKKLGYDKKLIRKSPPTSNTPASIQMRHVYCKFYKEMQEKGNNFYFIGSTDFHFLMYRTRGWALKHE
jgi:hypothetical protein